MPASSHCSPPRRRSIIRLPSSRMRADNNSGDGRVRHVRHGCRGITEKGHKWLKNHEPPTRWESPRRNYSTQAQSRTGGAESASLHGIALASIGRRGRVFLGVWTERVTLLKLWQDVLNLNSPPGKRSAVGEESAVAEKEWLALIEAVSHRCETDPGDLRDIICIRGFDIECLPENNFGRSFRNPRPLSFK